MAGAHEARPADVGQAVGAPAVLEPVDGQIPSITEEGQGWQEWTEETSGVKYGQRPDQGEVEEAETGLAAAAAKAAAEAEAEAEAETEEATAAE